MKRTYRNSNPNRTEPSSRLPEHTTAPTLSDDVTLRDLLTPEDVENALNVLRQRLKRNNKRVALRILKLYFGNAPKRSRKPDDSPASETKGYSYKAAIEEFYASLEKKYANKPEGGV